MILLGYVFEHAVYLEDTDIHAEKKVEIRAAAGSAWCVSALRISPRWTVAQITRGRISTSMPHHHIARAVKRTSLVDMCPSK